MSSSIIVKGAREHNLRNVSLEIPRNKLVTITGLSGSGKSSLAFDTIYAEGQRRYLESLSAYARQFLEQMRKPDVDFIDGLSPTISIDQKVVSRSPRSTVGTITEIYDYLRLLFSRLGTVYCPSCGKEVQRQTVNEIVEQVLRLPEGSRISVLAPIVRGKKGEYQKELYQMQSRGFTRVRIDGQDLSLAEPIKLKKTNKHDISIFVDRIFLRAGIDYRLAEAIEMAVGLADGIVEVEEVDSKKLMTYSTKRACVDCGINFPELEPRNFSFNSEHGACTECEGRGTQDFIDPNKVIGDIDLALNRGCVEPWASKTKKWLDDFFAPLKKQGVPLDVPWKELSTDHKNMALFGSDPFPGILSTLELSEDEDDDNIFDAGESYYSSRPCPECQGSRLKKEVLSIKVADQSIADICRLDLKKCLDTLSGIRFNSSQNLVAEPILKEITSRLTFLIDVGLSYLSLGRGADSLSGGEAQRIRLASQIGASLVGVLYVLDEPSIGLHPRDNEKLIQTLERLRDDGNSVLVVEHDEETIRRSDYVVDMGPGAGAKGGEVLFAGTATALLKEETSVTAQYLNGVRKIPVPNPRRPQDPQRQIRLVGASLNNLRNVNVTFPLGNIIGVTGVSGSGKSTLILDTLFPAVHASFQRLPIPPHLKVERVEGLDAIDKLIHVDQSPIGRTPRSNPATYTGVFGEIRTLFAGLPESKARGYGPGRFSFNVEGGRCDVCHGDGTMRISMSFLPDVYVECELCHGQRYNRETLEILYREKNIAQVLAFTIAEATEFFERIPQIKHKLATLNDVGLGYVHLGQSALTLSGGEAQRIKLAKELLKRSTGRTMYILDEPTTGLHFEDIRRLTDILHRLADQGNTVIVIEHNLDVIKQSDYVIDLGPEGGVHGGEVLFQGTPEGLAIVENSLTGKFLKETLHPSKKDGAPRKNNDLRTRT